MDAMNAQFSFNLESVVDIFKRTIAKNNYINVQAGSVRKKLMFSPKEDSYSERFLNDTHEKAW